MCARAHTQKAPAMRVPRKLPMVVLGAISTWSWHLGFEVFVWAQE